MPSTQGNRVRDAEWDRNRAYVLDRDGHQCRCGRSATTVDHIIPVSLGGSNSIDNLRAMCQSCNSARGNRVESIAAFYNTGWLDYI